MLDTWLLFKNQTLNAIIQTIFISYGDSEFIKDVGIKINILRVKPNYYLMYDKFVVDKLKN